MTVDFIGQPAEQGDVIDVAVVGAGIAGVYCAWRLLGTELLGPQLTSLICNRSSQRLKVTLYEATSRIGGRLYSMHLPGLKSVPAELGAMRYLNTHQLVKALISIFALTPSKFPSTSADSKLYLRRRHLQVSDFSDPAKVPYQLAANELGKRPGELLHNAIKLAVLNAPLLTEHDWRLVHDTWKIDGQPLSDVGFLNLLYRFISTEAYALMLDAGGYFSSLINWNAAEAIRWFLEDFAPGTEYYGIQEGYQELAKRLAHAFIANGGSLSLDHTLLSVDLVSDIEQGERLLRLTLYNRLSNTILVRLVRHLILALPRRALERLTEQTPLLQNRLIAADIQSVLPQPASKVFLAYSAPWWRSLGAAGRLDTDLPIRQIFYFDAEQDRPGTDSANANALLLARYNRGSGYALDYWSGLTGGAIFRMQPNRFVSPNEPAPASELTVSADEVEACQRQLSEAHGLQMIPRPYLAVRKDWADDISGGAWHFWAQRTRPIEIIQRLQRPCPGVNLYICGEAYSKKQAWVEGALISAEHLLQSQLELQRPSWLSPSYDLTP